MIKVGTAALLLASLVPAQVGISAIEHVGPGCGWLEKNVLYDGTEKFDLIPETNVRGRFAVSMYQPYLSTGRIEKWVAIGFEARFPDFHGDCEIYVDRLSPIFYFMWEDHSTWTYFFLPEDDAALHGMEFTLQGFVRHVVRDLPVRTDLSRGLRVTLGPGG